MELSRENLSKRSMPYLVAEVGVNHEGSLEKAKQLAGLAKKAGADAVKFQTFIPSRYVSTDSKERFERVSRFALSYEEFIDLKLYCDQIGVIFFSTPLHPIDVEFLNPIVPFFKVSSGDLTNLELIRSIAKTRKPLILSTGFGSESEIFRSIEEYEKYSEGMQVSVLMHTVPSYPTAPEKANLRNLQRFSQIFKEYVGYSDHTVGIEAAVLAHALGAKVIEKHFTDQKAGRSFRDHSLSVEPLEFENLKKRILDQEVLLGSFDRRVIGDDAKAAIEFRRSLALAKDFDEGMELAADDLISVRPGIGIPTEALSYVVGRKMKREKSQGSILFLDDLQ